MFSQIISKKFKLDAILKPMPHLYNLPERIKYIWISLKNNHKN